MTNADTHRKTIGYILWIFGFTGSHRYYYGYPQQHILPGGYRRPPQHVFILSVD